MSQWIHFVELPIPEGRKTKIWDVRTNDGEDSLGEIRWFGRWRRYAFWPRAECVFEHQCLKDLADFCVTETMAHARVRA